MGDDQVGIIDRASAEEIEAAYYFLNEKYANENLINITGDVLLFLNKFRQIVYVNKRATELLGTDEKSLYLGKRPGELLRCEHAWDSETGCGDSKACKSCGALLAVNESKVKENSEQECRLIQEGTNQAFDFLVKAMQEEFLQDQFAIVSLHDISHKKKCEVFERLFQYDLKNAAGVVKSLVDLFAMKPNERSERLFAVLQRSVVFLDDEISAQAQLVEAENDLLVVKPGNVVLNDFLSEIAEVYRQHQLGRGKEIVLASVGQGVSLLIDGCLLGRVIGCLLKNALEATYEGQQVVISYMVTQDNMVQIAIHNPAVIAEGVQGQIFQRSFTTKGRGRGNGAYMAKLYTENYLQGKISFESRDEVGTVFRVSFPRVFAE